MTRIKGKQKFHKKFTSKLKNTCTILKYKVLFVFIRIKICFIRNMTLSPFCEETWHDIDDKRDKTIVTTLWNEEVKLYNYKKIVQP